MRHSVGVCPLALLPLATDSGFWCHASSRGARESDRIGRDTTPAQIWAMAPLPPASKRWAGIGYPAPGPDWSALFEHPSRELWKTQPRNHGCAAVERREWGDDSGRPWCSWCPALVAPGLHALHGWRGHMLVYRDARLHDVGLGEFRVRSARRPALVVHGTTGSSLDEYWRTDCADF